MRSEFAQYQYSLYELKLPYCTVCTPEEGVNGTWHTPVTCTQSSNATYSLWFTTQDAPTVAQPSASISGKSILNSKVFKTVTSASESTPLIKPGKGMSSRSTISLSMADFDGDPGPINFSDEGSFFGKLLARNVLDGKELKVYNYSIANGVTYEISTAIYFIESAHLSNAHIKITGKDALKDIEAFGQQVPEPSNVTLTSDIDFSTTSIPVTDGSYLAAGDRFIIGEEIFRVISVSSNTITSAARGEGLTNGDSTVVYETAVDEHKSGDTVQKCILYNKLFLSNALEDIYNDVGLSAYVDFTQWDDEISEWSSSAFLYGVITEPVEAISLIDQMLQVYQVDMWLDQSSQKVVVSAVSAWKEAIRTISEVNDIQSLKIKTQPNQRYSRAYITHKKPLQALSDDKENYNKYTTYTDVATEVDDFYGSVKMYEFDPCPWISDSSSTQLVSRFVQRFADPPKELTFNIEERKLLDTRLGDIVDVITRDTQLPDGTEYGARITAQITQLKPVVNGIGRLYKAKALSYIPLIDTGGGDLVIFISGTVFDLNLYDRAGAPNAAVNVTYVLQGATIGSSDSAYGMRAGGFAAGSTIKIIATGGTIWSAKGGAGGDANAGETGSFVTVGGDGYDAYQSDGINTEIYLNYGTVDTYATDSTLYAAGGGGGSSALALKGGGGFPFNVFISSGGGGGSGIPGGIGGAATSGGFASDISKDGGNGSYSSEGFATQADLLFSTATGSDGAFSINAPNNGSTSIGTPYDTLYFDDTALSGSAGGAFRGSGITVYNLAADASKLRDGNSDPYTLVTV